jgi:hypothetical protein
MSDVRVRLLNDGGWPGLEKLDLNAVLDAREYYSMEHKCLGVEVLRSALIAAGGVATQLPAREYYFSNGKSIGNCLVEYEVVTDEQEDESTIE